MGIYRGDFGEMKSKVEKGVYVAKERTKNLSEANSTYREYIRRQVPMLEDLATYYRNASGQTKRKILGCIFSGKFVLVNGRVATAPFSTPVQVLLNAAKVLEGEEKETGGRN